MRVETSFHEGFALARRTEDRERFSPLPSPDEFGGDDSRAVNTEQAEKYFQQELLLARQIEHREWISVLLLNLGLMLQKQRNYIQAEAYLQEGLTLAEQLGIPQITCNILYEYGNLFLNLQQLREVETFFRKMLTLVPEGGQDLFALAHYGLARTASGLGNIDEAG